VSPNRCSDNRGCFGRIFECHPTGVRTFVSTKKLAPDVEAKLVALICDVARENLGKVPDLNGPNQTAKMRELNAMIADLGRQASAQVLNALAKQYPWLIGGSADLSPSTLTRLTFEGAGDFGKTTVGRNLHYGIREHAMAAAMNGIALSKVRTYGSGFFVFSDYARPSIRLASIMELPVVHIFTHDSIGVGEDGPTHQPIEHLASLRAIPGLTVLRPGDANEVVEAWRFIAERRHQPVVLVLSRQAMPTVDRGKYAAVAGLRRGAYVLADSPDPQLILIGTGTEVSLCVAAHEQLVASGVRSRVVSMPSWELFEDQDEAYRAAVLPPAVTANTMLDETLPLTPPEWPEWGNPIVDRRRSAPSWRTARTRTCGRRIIRRCSCSPG